MRQPAPPASPGHGTRGPVRVVVATTIFLSFISFWRAAAIVLADLGSSAFYAGGIAEEAVGKAAPWFILGVMLFSYAVRAIYIESSIMFVRGGVYRVVKEAMGGTLAKLSVSALLFDYVLTGPISAVSAGHYIVGLANDLAHRGGLAMTLPRDEVSAVIAAAVIVYFWWRNTQGLRESSSDALRIMEITTAMVVLLLAWAGYTLLAGHGLQVPPPPTAGHMNFSPEALGWLRGTALPSFTGIVVLVGLGHSFLAMSGWESLAQVYREIEHPKPANLRRAASVIFFYSVIFTVSVSFLAITLIPDADRPHFYDNLISGITMHLAGPLGMRLIFQALVVVVGFLMLAGAVNTALVGSNAVVNRVSEDGVLTEWFRKPHTRFGTTYRILNTIVLLQLATVVLSRGNVYVLGEAYAFGVVWSFALKSLALLVLRFKEPAPREWRVGWNLRLGRWEVPLGLAAISAALFAIALTNLFTKQTATIAGISFTLVLYVMFVFSERQARERAKVHDQALDQFQLEPAADLALGEVAARPDNVLVPVRDYNTLKHLAWALDSVDTEKRDIVVMTVRLLQGPDTPFQNIDQDQLFLDYEQLLFTRVVAVAERHGKPVKLLVVPSGNVFDAVSRTAVRLASAEIVVGESAKLSAEEQSRLLGEAWDRVPGSDKQRTRLVCVRLNGDVQTFVLGPHLPTLTTEDLEMIHKLWLEAVGEVGLRLHHRDVVRAALEDFRNRMAGREREQAMREIRRQVDRQ